MIGDAIVSAGHNRRFQSDSNILHGEMDCLEKAGHRDFSSSILFTTLSPCLMCGHAAILFQIPTIVTLDDENTDDYETSARALRDRNVEVMVAPHAGAMSVNAERDGFTLNPFLREVTVFFPFDIG